MSGINERATKGKVTKIDVSTIAKGVKRSLAELFIDREIEDVRVVVFGWNNVKRGNG